MGAILGIIFAVLILFVFLIYPIILFFKCLFDKAVDGTTKLIVFISSLFFFPIPSFCYGAFIKNSVLSKILLAFYVILIAVIVIFFLFFGGAAMFATVMSGGEFDLEGAVTQLEQGEIPQELQGTDETNIQDSYKGYNTYSTDEVNVFESSGSDEEVPADSPEKTPATNSAQP